MKTVKKMFRGAAWLGVMSIFAGIFCEILGLLPRHVCVYVAAAGTALVFMGTYFGGDLWE